MVRCTIDRQPGTGHLCFIGYESLDSSSVVSPSGKRSWMRSEDRPACRLSWPKCSGLFFVGAWSHAPNGDGECGFAEDVRLRIAVYDDADRPGSQPLAAGVICHGLLCSNLRGLVGLLRIFPRRSARGLVSIPVERSIPSEYDQGLHPDAILRHAFSKRIGQPLGEVARGCREVRIP